MRPRVRTEVRDFRPVVAVTAVYALSIVVTAGSGSAKQEGKVHPHLLRAASSSTDSLYVWVYLKDRDLQGSELRRAIQARQVELGSRALERRRLRGSITGVVMSDLPLSTTYRELLISSGLRLRKSSRWLNAVSGVVAPADLGRLAEHTFVVLVAPLGRGRRIEPPDRSGDATAVTGVSPRMGNRYAGGASAQFDPSFYGYSYAQILMVKVPPLHEQGLSGAGVIVGIMDTGFRLTHAALRDSMVLDTWDFVHDDPVVSNEPGDLSIEQNHGTKVWGVLAGYWPGVMVGPAFGAELLLAKTEDEGSETPVEEDNWIAAMEWMEARGVDVTNTSLGYSEWYSYRDMDGNTAPITIAADAATARGVLVVTSAGNEGDMSVPEPDDTPVQYYIGAPADGDSVIAVGATNNAGERVYYTSHGPTFDGRIKPDVMAQGIGIATAYPAGGDSTLDLNASGTSFASPLVAGVAALILEAHPDWDPMEIREALQATADRSRNSGGLPDNDYGWGLVMGADAVAYGSVQPEEDLIFFNYPNPFSDATTFNCTVPSAGEVRIYIFTLGGSLVTTLEGISTIWEGTVPVPWDGTNDSGKRVAPAAYLAVLEFQGHRATTTVLVVR